jgi:hypothetical protein
VDLKAQLLEALNNPARVWDAVLTNLAAEPRMTLLVFTTCMTPVSMISWQEAVARLSADSAMRFEASLRVLDDSFITVHRRDAIGRSDGLYYASFRNPSMDDFCAGYLDRNVGIAVTVASHQPVLPQINRLITLGTARVPFESNPSDFRPSKYPNIHEALITRPSLLLGRLMEIMPVESNISDEQIEVAQSILILLSQASHVSSTDLAAIRARMAPLFKEVEFGLEYDSFLYTVLDVPPRARALANLLEDDFEQLYDRLAVSAATSSHFDTLVRIDEALGRSPADASWANNFARFMPTWIHDDLTVDEVYSLRRMYERVAEYLDLDANDDELDWDELRERAEEAEDSEIEVGIEDEASLSPRPDSTFAVLRFAGRRDYCPAGGPA